MDSSTHRSRKAKEAKASEQNFICLKIFACIATVNKKKESYHLGASIYRNLGSQVVDSTSPILELERDAKTETICQKPTLQLIPTLWVID